MSQSSRASAFGTTLRRRAFAALLGGAVCLLGSALQGQVRVPGFKPSNCGFHFNNRWPSIPLLYINIFGAQVPIGDAANGLCGGMAYAARDFYQAGLLTPSDTTSSDGLSRPPQVLFNYLVKRLFDSFELPGGPLEYMHLMNPDLPDHETDFSRIGLAPHGRAWVMIMEEWPKIRTELDQGLPSPMALIRVKSHDPFEMGKNHQVLAYGYDQNGSDLTIHVYDPNYPERNDVNISLSLADPQHTTAVTYSMGDQFFCFFHTGYQFDSPPITTSCTPGARSGYVLSTGVDGSGQPIANGLDDPTFAVTSPGGAVACATIIPDDEFPIGPWAASTPGSKWIGLRKLSSNGLAGRYSFLARLDLPAGAAAEDLALVGSWTSDDATVDLRVNGVSTGITGSGDFTVLTPFPASAGLGLFRPGRNTVEFLVDNGSSSPENPVGLRVEAYLSPIPRADLVVTQLTAEPGTLSPGGTVSVNLITANPGSLASAATVTRIYLRRAGGAAQVHLGYVNVPALCAGCGASASVQFTVPAGTAGGSYTIGACAEDSGVVTEANEGNNCATGGAVTVEGSQPADCERDDFEGRRLAGWVPNSGEWRLSEGNLVGIASDDEAWIWSGAMAAGPVGDAYALDLQIIDGGGDPAVGRHAGLMFCATSPTRRLDESTSGYTLDWIDREEDHGLRLLRFDRGVATPLQVGTPQLADPPANWRITLDARRIRVHGDGVLYLDVADATYRGGHLGLWAYPGQTLQVDYVSFGTGCSGGGMRRPFDLNQDGALQLSDCISLLGFLYLGSPSQLPCGDGTAGDLSNKRLADYNGDGVINLSDPVAALSFLFLGGAPPAAGQACLPIPGCPEVAGGGCAGG